MVSQLITLIIIVATYPNQFGLAGAIERTDFPNNIEVLDLTALLLPAGLLPIERPLRDDVNPKLTVTVDFARLAVGMLQGGHQRVAFHADIGRLGARRLTAQYDRLTVMDDGVTAWAGIRAGTTIGIVNIHLTIIALS